MSMKKVFNAFLAISMLLGVMLFSSCISDGNDEIVKSYQLTIHLKSDDDLNLNDASSVCVSWNNDKGQSDSLFITKDTTVTVVQGMYDFVVSGKVIDEANAYISGISNANVFSNSTVTIPLSKVERSTLIFKAIYTTGGKLGYIKDSYFEIVNNSDEVQYLDGVILSSPTGNQRSPNAWQSHGITDLYNSGSGCVVAFPGSGHDYPLQPGQSVIISNDAVDHSQLAGDGNHCPDLSQAGWEIYLSDINGEIDYQAPNMDVIFNNNPYMKAFGLGFFGRAYFLARLPQNLTPKEFASDPKNLQTIPGVTSNTQYLMIPSKYVLDAVDIWSNSSNTHYGTFLPKDDAQGVLASKAWAGFCVRRKVTKIVNGRDYYQDTNNSANDFLNNQPAKPGYNPTSVDQ